MGRKMGLSSYHSYLYFFLNYEVNCIETFTSRFGNIFKNYVTKNFKKSFIRIFVCTNLGWNIAECNTLTYYAIPD